MKISKKTAKILNIVIIALAVILIISSFGAVNAATDQFTPVEGKQSTLSGKATDIGGMILGVAQAVGMAVAVIMLVVLAIKYISASPNDKAEIKKNAVIYITGAVILFASSAIVGIIKNFATNSITA